ncbi:MAG UNVERIFIED_CONTAM: helicase RecD/TraA [Rickettsiaceae bacterium]|jgi:exodeoxyribonuclease V alpha subunit
MNSLFQDEKSEDLSGVVERVIRHNPENGFCILKAFTEKETSIIIKCVVPDIAPGESFKASGIWQKDNNSSFFKASYFKPILPTTNEGIYKFLSSPYMQNIGPYYAKKLVEEFSRKYLALLNLPQTF